MGMDREAGRVPRPQRLRRWRIVDFDDAGPRVVGLSRDRVGRVAARGAGYLLAVIVDVSDDARPLPDRSAIFAQLGNAWILAMVSGSQTNELTGSLEWHRGGSPGWACTRKGVASDDVPWARLIRNADR